MNMRFLITIIFLISCYFETRIFKRKPSLKDSSETKKQVRRGFFSLKSMFSSRKNRKNSNVIAEKIEIREDDYLAQSQQIDEENGVVKVDEKNEISVEYGSNELSESIDTTKNNNKTENESILEHLEGQEYKADNSKISSENKHLLDLAKKELQEGNLEFVIDCLIALILNSQTEEEEQLRKKECISLCNRSESKSRKMLAEVLQLGNKLESSERLFEKARKYTAKREYSKARDIFLALYIVEEDQQKKFDQIYRCAMLALNERKFYLARGFLMKARELINKNDSRWTDIMIKIAGCEDRIGNTEKAKSIIYDILRSNPNYKPKTEREKKLIESFMEEMQI